jgi:hypothetical protein
MNSYRYRIRRGPPFGFAGVLIVIGGLLLLNNLGILNLGYAWGLFWPGILILMGVSMMRGRPKAFGLFLMLLGGIFFAGNLDVLPADWEIGRLWPVFLVGFGVWMLLKSRRSSERRIEL